DGVFRDGKVELVSVPPGLIDGTPVTVRIPAMEGEVRPPELDSEREASRRRAIARMEKGFHLGGAPYPTREEIHERSGR
ncbi:MAG TPA: hypothetical protein VGH33_25735, partial [Isosphaeraceae bacterium]